MANRALVHPVAWVNTLLSGRVPGRALAEAEQSVHREGVRNPFGVSAQLPHPPRDARGGEHPVCRIPAGPAERAAVLASAGPRFARGVDRDAACFLSLRIGHTIGDCRAPMPIAFGGPGQEGFAEVCFWL